MLSVQRVRATERDGERHTYRQIGRQTERQTERNKHTHRGKAIREEGR